MTPSRPQPDEYDPYYGLYIDQAPDGDILELMEQELEETLSGLGALAPEQETYRYAAGKWSLREIVGHLIDTEWTFAYRGLCIARTDPAHLPGFDQELWARASVAGSLPMSELLVTFACARRSSIAIFRGFDEAAWLRRGMANECEFSVRSMPYILTGH
ncbi:MAG: DinB family protein, partial [Acidobacteriota bacterium]